MPQATGTFEVKLVPRKHTDEEAESAGLVRMSMDKQFYGELEGTSKGEMLSFVAPVEGSAGYVALERVSGRLLEWSGSFVLQHSGRMTRGEPNLSITVVPDSGTGDLVALSGNMKITEVDGRHFYDFVFEMGEHS